MGSHRRLPSYRRELTTTPPQRTVSHLRLAAAGVWLLPVYALFLTLSMLTHEPDHAVDCPARSRYGTTDVFVVIFAAAAYAQPAIGRAVLAGVPGAEDLTTTCTARH